MSTGYMNRAEMDRMDSMEETLRPDSPRPRSREVDHYGGEIGTARRVVLITVFLLGLLFSSMDASIVSTALVTISIDLQDFLNAPWAVLSYLLAYLGFAVGFAKMSDIYGRRPLFITSWLLFSGFSFGCGFARTMEELIIFRAFQGIGGSGLYSLAQIGLFEVGPRHKPSLMGALVGMTLAISFVLGPILGGTITRLSSWRWIFYINVPAGSLAILCLHGAWPSHYSSDKRGSWKVIDYPGNISLVAASTLLVFALQQAGSLTYSWSSGIIISTLILGLISWIVFFLWEYYISRYPFNRMQPIFPMRLVKQRVYTSAFTCTLFTGFSYLAIIIILPERFQIINDQDALNSGIHLLPLLGACALGSFLAGAVSAKRNNTSPTLIVASCLQLLGMGLLSTLSDVVSEIKTQYLYQAIFGLGVGLTFGGATIMSSVTARQEDLAVAQGAIAQARVFGGALGIAICSIVFNKYVQDQLANLFTEQDLAALHHSPTIATYMTGAEKQVVRRVYAMAFTTDIKVMMGICGAGVFASLFSFQRNPPPMPSAAHAQQRKEHVETPRSGMQSDTELEDHVQLEDLTERIASLKEDHPQTPKRKLNNSAEEGV